MDILNSMEFISHYVTACTIHVQKSALIFDLFEKMENADPVIAASFKSKNHL